MVSKSKIDKWFHGNKLIGFDICAKGKVKNYNKKILFHLC